MLQAGDKDHFLKINPNGTAVPNPILSTRATFTNIQQPFEGLEPWHKDFLKSVHKEPSHAHRKELQKAFDSMKDLFIARIRDGRSKDELSPMQVKLIDQFKKVQLKMVVSEKHAPCSETSAGGANYAKPLLVMVCGSMLNLPISALIPILAHELGHAIDPCVMDTYTYVPEKISEIRNGNLSSLQSCGLNKNEIEAVRQRISDTPPNSITMSPLDAGVLYRCGIAKPTFEGVETRDLQHYPFMNTAKCSDQRRESEGIPIRREWVARFNSGVEIPTPLSGSLYCQMSGVECFADHVGGQMTAEYLRVHGLSAHHNPDDFLQTFTEYACFPKEFSSTHYLNPNQRLAAYLEHPEVQEKMGCSGLNQKPFCPSDLENPKAKKPEASRGIQ